jgi:hypothetical protein
MRATRATSAATGAWSGLGMASVQAWLDLHPAMTVHAEDLLLLLAFVVFIALPAYVFVFGRDATPFGRDLLTNPAERARQGATFKRLFTWLVIAGAVGIAWSFALMAMLRVA